MGAELEVFASYPHGKQQQITAPGGGPTVTALGNGAHIRTLTIALNMIARYRWNRLQPYAWVGLAFVNARVSDESMSISDSSPGLDLLAGRKGFLTDHRAVFVEGK